MLRLLLFFVLSFPLVALELSLSGAKENFSNYSSLHLKDATPFLCEETKDDFDVVTKIVCAFAKKPPQKLRILQNSFFKIENTIQDKTFFLIITPYKKIKLYPMVFDMTQDTKLYQADVKLSTHWMLVGYEKSIPFMKEETHGDTAINFPFELEKNSLPYVGSLDIKGNPVHLQRVGDVTDYLKIKKLYTDKKYDKALELIEEVMQDYPYSLFNAELIFYKIRVYAKLSDYDNVISMSKAYLQEYSSDENIPEVLSLIAHAYSKIGMLIDADYFFDRLFSEHEDSEHTKLAYIYKGEMLESTGGASKAVSYYERSLKETQDLDTAAMAAYKLAKYNSSIDALEKSSEYAMKIIKAKPAFFMHNLVTSMNMMYKFGDNEKYEVAAAIAKAITDATDKEHDEHENLMKERAMWLSKADDKHKALDALNAYIDAYEFGNYEQMIEVAKDELFFDTNDGNFSHKLQEYNALIEAYENDTIGDRAIYEKARLLLENEKYAEVLNFEESIDYLDKDIYEDVDLIIQNAAIGVMKLALENKQCQEVLHVSKDYNITLSNDWDDGIYECSMVGADFITAKEIASRNLNAKELELRKKWLYRYIEVDFARGNYKDIVEATKELLSLIEGEKDSEYTEAYRIMFDIYHRLEDEEKLFASMMQLQEVFGQDYKDIERYVTMMSIGNKNKDDNVVVRYGEEVMQIQNKSASYAQSPFVEFTLYQSYRNLEELEKAQAILESLDTVELSGLQRARQKYLLGTLYAKLWREEDANRAYKQAIEADPNSPWAKLATSAQGVI